MRLKSAFIPTNEEKKNRMKKKKSRNNITLKNIRELPKGVIMGTTVGIMELLFL